MRPRRGVTVVGSHGKTTTAAMVTHVLKHLGQEPTAVLGARMLGSMSGVRYGTGPLFVAEADESDGSLRAYQPVHALLTGVGQDHLDYYRSAERLEAAFRDHVGSLGPGGTAVINGDDPASRRIARRISCRTVIYGFHDTADVRVTRYCGSGVACTFEVGTPFWSVPCRLNTFGRHNASNAAAALAFVGILGLDVTEASRQLEHFPGVERRLSVVAADAEWVLVDDFAHNPEKIQAAIAAVRESWSKFRLIAVYQPHRLSRMRTIYGPLTASFRAADQVAVLPIYPGYEPGSGEFPPVRVAADIARASAVDACGGTPENIAAWITSQGKPPCVVLVLGAGEVKDLTEILKERLFSE